MSYQLMIDPNANYSPLGTTPQMPPNAILESGGGIANFVHGGERRMYARDGERSDIFGNSLPLTDKTYGNMYNNGPSYLEGHGLWTPSKERRVSDMDYAWDHSTPRQYYPDGIGQQREAITRLDSMDRNGAYNNRFVEGFNVDENTPLDYGSSQEGVTNVGKPSMIVIFIILTILFIAFELWTTSFSKFAKQYIFKKDKLTLNNYIVLAVIITILFLSIMYFAGYDFTTIF